MFDRYKLFSLGGTPMPVRSVWESRFAPAEAQQGRAITEAIWRDMTEFDGYVAHELIEDLDDPGHLLVISHWASRHDADEVLREYADHPNARLADELASRPRTRFVGHVVSAAK
jgi:quinol monooxygenase YgiN